MTSKDEMMLREPGLVLFIIQAGGSTLLACLSLCSHDFLQITVNIEKREALLGLTDAIIETDFPQITVKVFASRFHMPLLPVNANGVQAGGCTQSKFDVELQIALVSREPCNRRLFPYKNVGSMGRENITVCMQYRQTFDQSYTSLHEHGCNSLEGLYGDSGRSPLPSFSIIF
ncbi:hypothetical protein B0T20DRAFT_392276 [Sordaria brevicollis]|uniref:Uncharacterized protein n=1 Tax=Sordaria brevicollis TaxID=83679 RepID=A0AAE0UCP2_SORBR|nr:hypothetical protein B0T20DRAFT_392276 [Sordaria brevicollis]